MCMCQGCFKIKETFHFLVQAMIFCGAKNLGSLALNNDIEYS